MECEVRGPLLCQSAVCAPILRALPGWFGIEAATEKYISDIDGLPTFIAAIGGQVVGFLTLKQHNEFSAEIYVMGVKVEMHHKGIGSALVQAAEATLRQQGTAYLQVKTLSAKHPDVNYARTRAFYFKLGFRPLEELEIWGSENPCLLMVKAL
jgi:ribosomal protein S18 acetylase RimI-like enzyme